MKLQQLFEDENRVDLSQLQNTCDNFGSGFYWEEGGCWAMALALGEYFQSLGLTPTYHVDLGMHHCYAGGNGKLYDYTGVCRPQIPLTTVSKKRLIEIAHIANKGNDLVSDFPEARAIIAAATST